jgi:hypothetical protein
MATIDSLQKFVEKFQNKVGEKLDLTCLKENITTEHVSISWEEYLIKKLELKSAIAKGFYKLIGWKTDIFGGENVVSRPFKCMKCGTVRIKLGK